MIQFLCNILYISSNVSLFYRLIVYYKDAMVLMTYSVHCAFITFLFLLTYIFFTNFIYLFLM